MVELSGLYKHARDLYLSSIPPAPIQNDNELHKRRRKKQKKDGQAKQKKKESRIKDHEFMIHSFIFSCNAHNSGMKACA